MGELSNSALRAQLGNALRQLQVSLKGFAEYVQSDARDAWVWHPPPSGADGFSQPRNLTREQTLRRIATGIQAIKYADAQDAHQSLIWPGVVTVAREGISLAEEVNRHKVALAETLKAMEGRTEIGTVDSTTGERGERPLREVALEAFYFRRLHYWQATRRLEILRASDQELCSPDYIGFMWASSRDYRPTSREELLQGSASEERPRLNASDIEIVESLPVGEPLVVVRPGRASARANIRWEANMNRDAVTMIRVAVLPFVVLGDRLPARLRKLPPVPTPKHFRLARRDTEIEPTALLPHLSVYRYLEQFREEKRRDPARSD